MYGLTQSFFHSHFHSLERAAHRQALFTGGLDAVELEEQLRDRRFGRDGRVDGLRRACHDQPSGPLLKPREHFISRIYPRAVWGELLDFSYDSYHQSFTMNAVADAAGTTLIYIPPIVNGTVTIAASGVAEEHGMTINPDNSRLVNIHIRGAGAYQVNIAPAGNVVYPLTTKGTAPLLFMGGDLR